MTKNTVAVNFVKKSVGAPTDDTAAVDRATILAKAKRAMTRATTAADVCGVVATHKDALGYRVLLPLITAERTGAKRTLTLKVAVACQKSLRACATKADVVAWLAEHGETLSTRKAGRLLSYPGTSPASLIT